MTITFHCDHCNKKIEAKDSAGGKWGRCPSCGMKVYVPDLKADEEAGELKLAPIDEEEIKKERELMEETREITQNIMEERDAGEGGAGVDAEGAGPSMSKDEVKNELLACLNEMHAGQESAYSSRIKRIQSNKGAAMDILEQIALSDMPEPELEKIKPQELSSLIRQLRTKIS